MTKKLSISKSFNRQLRVRDGTAQPFDQLEPFRSSIYRFALLLCYYYISSLLVELDIARKQNHNYKVDYCSFVLFFPSRSSSCLYTSFLFSLLLFLFLVLASVWPSIRRLSALAGAAIVLPSGPTSPWWLQKVSCSLTRGSIVLRLLYSDAVKESNFPWISSVTHCTSVHYFLLYCHSFRRIATVPILTSSTIAVGHCELHPVYRFLCYYLTVLYCPIYIAIALFDSCRKFPFLPSSLLITECYYSLSFVLSRGSDIHTYTILLVYPSIT